MGLIPARAGNTARHAGAGCRCRAHPRSRGEHTFAGQVRGFPPRAHPRSRGEHERGRYEMFTSQGSSPLARGTRSRPFAPTLCWGLIPARAGNTLWVASRVCWPGAHPRSRGEHRCHRRLSPATGGSSPLARGTPMCPLGVASPVGLIPARAGNTLETGFLKFLVGAHPRSRGEHRRSFRRPDRHTGSSPLARGTHLLTWGFTPYISKIESLWSQSLHPEYTINNCS